MTMIVMRAELFSISPSEEQLAWEIKCRSEREVPNVQSSVFRWLVAQRRVASH